jgi:hypothetical protein
MKLWKNVLDEHWSLSPFFLFSLYCCQSRALDMPFAPDPPRPRKLRTEDQDPSWEKDRLALRQCPRQPTSGPST